MLMAMDLSSEPDAFAVASGPDPLFLRFDPFAYGPVLSDAGTSCYAGCPFDVRRGPSCEDGVRFL